VGRGGSELKRPMFLLECFVIFPMCFVIFPMCFVE